MIGYKAFDVDLTCCGFQYEIGKTYKKDKIKLGYQGFHFCEHPIDVLIFYDGLSSRFAVIQADGEIIRDVRYRKAVCSQITIIEEITLDELLKRTPSPLSRSDGSVSTWFKNDDNTLIGIHNRNEKGTEKWSSIIDGKYIHCHNPKEGEPTIIFSNGDKHWCEYGVHHRSGGLPAVECSNGLKGWSSLWSYPLRWRWWIKGKFIRSEKP